MTFINAFTSSVLGRVVRGSNLDGKTIANKLNYMKDYLVRSWINGGNLPALRQLVALADIVELPAEDLIIPWLCDQDPANHDRYKMIARQLGGAEYAADLLSGSDENSADPWWGMARKPAPAAEIVARARDPDT